MSNIEFRQVKNNVGGLISIIVRSFLTRYVLTEPINIIWLPFMLSYLVRADNDFYIFFNGLVKGFLIFWIINYVRRYYLEPKSGFSPANPITS